MITQIQLAAILVGNKEVATWLPLMNKFFLQYKINTKERIAGFLSQCTHESANFTRLEENLNYSADGLKKTFPKYFKTVSATLYHRKPEAIANLVYGNRMGNTAPGDGWKFRGRGVIQLTGKDNYGMFAKFKGMTLDEVIEYLKTKEGALESACWFWNSRNINAAADEKNVTKMTLLINGGSHGLASRQQYFKHALQVLSN